MALEAYLSLTGQKQGPIKGSITQKGLEGSIGIIAAQHGIVSPRDPQSGLPTGQRMHKPFVLTKEIDRSTPLLYNVLVTNENISHWELKCFTSQGATPSGAGTVVQFYTVRLTNANIASIEFTMPNMRNPDLSRLADYEQLAFTYQKIEWVWTDGGVTASDDWEARV